ncbi:MAG: hypothetical protein WC782_06125 [Methylococcaceae bacterium]|jgi:hypothetical protein
MLTLTQHQLDQLDAEARSQFAALLTGQLQADYPALFQPLPQALAQRMVAHKIDYAEERYDIHFQSALTTYLHYCCAIGPKFDEQPEIQGMLDNLSHYPDDIPDLLADEASEAAWSEADDNARRSHWFGQDGSQLNGHIAARTCWALADIANKQSNIQPITDDATLTNFIATAIQTARQQQITDAKGITAFAVCQHVFGKHFYQQQSKDWVALIFTDSSMLPWLRGTALALGVELEWQLEL